jgi:oligopeptide/dipeptide ABC transporter ATP-binding protein
MILQDADDALNPIMKVGEQIAESAHLHQGLGWRESRLRATHLLRLLGLADPEQRFHAYPHQLSGGMRHKVMIAIALAGNPAVLIADEITRALDAVTQAEILELLKELQRRLGMALIFISHDLELAATLADDVLVMYEGRPIECAPSDALFSRPRTPYTKALLEAVPTLERAGRSVLTPTNRRPPERHAMAAGCALQPRCPQAKEICAAACPPFIEEQRGHRLACWFPYPREGPVQ